MRAGAEALSSTASAAARPAPGSPARAAPPLAVAAPRVDPARTLTQSVLAYARKVFAAYVRCTQCAFALSLALTSLAACA
eukprot:7325207-Alexandrium_andersonii.AAC.1